MTMEMVLGASAFRRLGQATEAKIMTEFHDFLCSLGDATKVRTRTSCTALGNFGEDNEI